MQQLIKYDAACRALAEARDIDEVKEIKDKSEALRLYAKQVNNAQMEADAWAIRKRAEDKFGELSLQMEKAHKAGPGTDVNFPACGKSKKEQLLALGISTSAAQRYERFHLLPEVEKRAQIAKGKEAIRAGKSIADVFALQSDKRDRRDRREADLGQKICALPGKRYGVIVVDPEWRFEVWSREAEESDSPIEEMGDVAALAADNCVLGLWSTVPMLEHAFEIMKLWGFVYKTTWVWAKDRIGPGYWNRNKHEHFLFGTRGEVPGPAPGQQWDSLLEAPRRGLGEKPDIFLEMMEAYFPHLPKIELTKHGKPRPGWDSWVVEAEPKPTYVDQRHARQGISAVS